MLGIIVALGLIGFLGIRPYQPWILWLTAGLAGLAADGIVRSNPGWQARGPLASLVFVVLPLLAVLGAGFFIDHAIDGYARPVAAVVPAVAVGLITWAEYHTVDLEAKRYASMRLGLAVATYLAAFALYTVIFTNRIGLATGTIVTGLVSAALALELLRETRPLGPSALLVSLAIGVSLAELRLALYFFPLDGLLAGALLIIGFYLATGIVHHLLDHDLEMATTAEYLLVAAAGTIAVVVTRVAV
jgi:Protein of unknown function (DUF5656)